MSADERAPDATLDAPQLASALVSSEVGARLGRAAEPAPGAVPVAGQRFAGRYDLDVELGRGGMGVVFRARDSMLGGEEVALKVLFADASAPQAIERFRREVLLSRRITSPRVARTHDLGEHGGVFYLTMELVEGESLAVRLHRLAQEGKRLAPHEAVRIVRAIAEGLAAAHAKDVVHRDLKPDNVLLGPGQLEDRARGQRVVVTDFGIARAFRGPEALRATQGIAGTPAYMSPEQLEGKPTDARTDLYALGIVLYECLTGQLPFHADTPIAAALLRLHQPPREIDPALALPAPLVQLVGDLLARSPEARPATAEQVMARIDALALPLGEGTSSLTVLAPVGSPTPPTVTPRGTRSSARADVGLAVLPFEHRGPASEASVTSGVRDELIDVLSRTQGIRVVGRGALDGASPQQVSDVRSFESRFGARFAAEASMQVAAGGARMRASVRLLEVASGVQVWSEVVDLEVTDPFVASERMAYKIAEALRLALEVAAYEGKVSRELLDTFRQARKAVRGAVIHDPQAIFDQLDRVIREAPGFAPPLAVHALGCVRQWFTPQQRSGRDWRAETQRSIERARDQAAHLAETRFAAASVAWQEVRLRDAVSEARAALAVAPAFPDAMAFLGQLELEVGRPEQGLVRLAQARDLEPSLRVTVLEPARWHGLYGDMSEFTRLLRLVRLEHREEALVGQYLVRVGAWRGQDAMVREGIQVLSRTQHPIAAPLTNYGRTVLGEAQPAPLPPEFLAAASPRLRTVALQMQAEAWGHRGDRDTTLAMITAASQVALTDLEWIDKCPFFGALRDEPAFHEARQRVLMRCEEIWLAG